MSGPEIRVRTLITGSRTWVDWRLMYELIKTGKQHCMNIGKTLVIVHGACPRGADHIADLIAYTVDVEVERYPASWHKHGRQAGFVRNKLMVDTRPQLCLAFIRDQSRGASMCADLAEKAGIPTFRYTDRSEL